MSKMQVHATGYALTAIDIAALRKADRIVFRHNAQHGSAVEAIKECKKTARDPFASDIVHIVPAGFKLTDYGRKYGDGRESVHGDFKAFEMEHSPSYEDSSWSGPAAFLRAGDVLRLLWLRDAKRTQAMEESGNGFHGDCLMLQVLRGESAKFTFMIECSVCQDNSARMIRY